MNLLRYDTPDGIAAFTTGRDCCVEALGLQTEALALPRQTHSDHDHQIKEHHGRIEGQRRESIDKVRRDLCVGILPGLNVAGHSLGEELHRKPQDLPHKGGIADNGKFSVDPQRVDYIDPGDRDLQRRKY